MKAGVVHAKMIYAAKRSANRRRKWREVLIRVNILGYAVQIYPGNGDDANYFRMFLWTHFGTVEQTGEGVEDPKEGDRVAGVPLVPCMKCRTASGGLFSSLCKDYSFIGSRNLEFAEYVVVVPEKWVRFDDEVTLSRGHFSNLRRLRFTVYKKIKLAWAAGLS